MKKSSQLIVIVTTLVLSGCQTIDTMNKMITSGVSTVTEGISGLVGNKEADSGLSSVTNSTSSNTSSSTSPIKTSNLNSDITGFVQPVFVTDGDTFVINNTRIRLYGIDAPELKQTCMKENSVSQCGLIAKNVLIGFAAGEEVRCVKRDTDRYGRVVGQCFVEGYDLSDGMVRSGNAVAYRKYSSEYIMAEGFAKGNKLGVWAGKFDMPWDWRKKYK